MLRAISLWQPWASLLVWGEKRTETRHWPTPHRGWLAIHAAQTRTPARHCLAPEVARYDPPFYDAVARHVLGPGEAVGRAHDLVKLLPYGALVGLVYQDGCELMTSAIIAVESQHELRFGDWREGRYAWRTSQPRVATTPIPCVGRQGFWTLDTETAARLSEVCGR